MSEPVKITAAQRHLVESFRAYLQTVITAEQFGQSARLPALPGAKTADYCAALAKLAYNTLADELAKPVWAMLREIDRAAMEFHRALHHNMITDPAKRAEHEKVLEQLDFALALILRRLPAIARFRAKRTKNIDLMCEVMGMSHHGTEAAGLIRRYQKEFPEENGDADGNRDDGGFLESFAWDTYQRVEALDRLADEFPEHIRFAAKQMHGWPMLQHRHTSNRKRFQALAARLDLGADYPLDASEGARFRPGTPLIRYLDALACKVNYVHGFTVGRSYESDAEQRKALRSWWWDGQDERPSDELVEVLRAVPLLPPLTKATASEWAEKIMVPVIMLTEASDWKNCEEQFLRRIAKQAGVKSQATFKSRLRSAVSSTLRRLARPA